jgi:hypothetical protein
MSASNPSGSRAMHFKMAFTGNGTGLSMSIITTYLAGEEPTGTTAPPATLSEESPEEGLNATLGKEGFGELRSPEEGVRGDVYPPSSMSSSLFRACAICSMRQGLLSNVRAAPRLSSSSRVNLSHCTRTWSAGASDAHFINSLSVPSSELFS